LISSLDACTRLLNIKSARNIQQRIHKHSLKAVFQYQEFYVEMRASGCLKVAAREREREERVEKARVSATRARVSSALARIIL